MIKPVRIQLSRAKGFRLQEVSRAINGLEAVNCARPGRYGNPFSVVKWGRAGAIKRFRETTLETLDLLALRGKNLACFCGLDEACHVDTILEAANK